MRWGEQKIVNWKLEVGSWKLEVNKIFKFARVKLRYEINTLKINSHRRF